MPYISFCGLCGSRAHLQCYEQHQADIHSQYIPDSDADSSLSSQVATPAGAITPRPEEIEAFPGINLYISTHNHSNPAGRNEFLAGSATPVRADVEAAPDTSPAASICVRMNADREDRARCWTIFERAMRSLGIQEKAHGHEVAVEVLRRIGDVIGDEIGPERRVVEDALNDRQEALVHLRAVETQVQVLVNLIEQRFGGEAQTQDRAVLDSAVLRLTADLDDLSKKYEEFDKLYTDKAKELRMMILLHEYLKKKYPSPSRRGVLTREV